MCPDDKTYEEWIKSSEEGSDQHLLRPRQAVQLQTAVFPEVLIDRISRAIRLVGTDYSDSPAAEEANFNCGPKVTSPTDRFFGDSSGEVLVRTALTMKDEYTGVPRSILCSRREEFWTARPWEKYPGVSAAGHYIFPELDLSASLVELYFDNVNLYLPLLHRPSFLRLVEEGLHHTDDSFAAVYLLVCAVGSRFSTDPRVLFDGFESYHSAGWKWFNQVDTIKTVPLSPPSLYDVQFYCLSVLFLQSSSTPTTVWTMVGIAIRSVQDVGFHRRKVPTFTLEDELWKRAFWVLLCLDRTISVSLGRPCAINEEDYDLEMPIDCDDEYWEHPEPEKRFKQASNKPSLISAFILLIKLMQILIYCIRGIYSLKSTNLRLGLIGEKWKTKIVAELDSSLNRWLSSVPEHLRWDPKREDNKFFNLSAMLYATYYHIRILIHRPFIPLPGKPFLLPIPSLAICTNAARACCEVVYTQLQRNTIASLPFVQVATLSSAIVLLFGIWREKKPSAVQGENGDLASVAKCLQVLKAAEERWNMAGKFWELLCELSSLQDPSPSRQQGQAKGTVEAPLALPTSGPGKRQPISFVPHPLPQPTAEEQQSLLYHQCTPEVGRYTMHGGTSAADNAFPHSSVANRAYYGQPAEGEFSQQTYSYLQDSSQRQLGQDRPGAQGDQSPAASVYPPTFRLREDATPQATSPFNLLVQASMAARKVSDPQSPPVTAASGPTGRMLAGATTGITNAWHQQRHKDDEHDGYLVPSSGGSRQQQEPADGGDFNFNDRTNLWSNAPTGFGLDDWNLYLSSMSEFAHSNNFA